MRKREVRGWSRRDRMEQGGQTPGEAGPARLVHRLSKNDPGELREVERETTETDTRESRGSLCQIVTTICLTGHGPWPRVPLDSASERTRAFFLELAEPSLKTDDDPDRGDWRPLRPALLRPSAAGSSGGAVALSGGGTQILPARRARLQDDFVWGVTARSTALSRIPNVIAITTALLKNSLPVGGRVASQSFCAAAARGRVNAAIKVIAVVSR